MIGDEWVQVGELGLAFIVVILCSGLITFVMRTSARREQELMNIITKVLPLMESLSAGLENVTTGLANAVAGINAVNTSLESIEDNPLSSPGRVFQEANFN